MISNLYGARRPHQIVCVVKIILFMENSPILFVLTLFNLTILTGLLAHVKILVHASEVLSHCQIDVI